MSQKFSRTSLEPRGAEGAEPSSTHLPPKRALGAPKQTFSTGVKHFTPHGSVSAVGPRASTCPRSGERSVQALGAGSSLADPTPRVPRRFGECWFIGTVGFVALEVPCSSPASSLAERNKKFPFYFKVPDLWAWCLFAFKHLHQPTATLSQTGTEQPKESP